MTYIAIWCLSATKASHVGPRWRSDDQDDLRRNRRLSLLAMCTSTWNQRTLTIELPGRALVSVEGSVDPELMRTVLGSLLR